MNLTLDTIILSAGNASRFGSAKQLATFQGKSFLEITIKKAQQLNCRNIFVVLGAYHQEITSKIQSKDIIIVHNESWKQGMGSSIQAGMKAINALEDKPNGLLILLIDQPGLLVNNNHLDTMVSHWRNDPNQSIATDYNNQLGAPCIINSKWFDALQTIPSNKGAKSLLNSEIENIVGISSKEAFNDIDTKENYLQFLKQHQEN